MTPMERTVLVASDQPSRAEALAAALRRWSLSIRRVLGTGRAIDAVRQEPVDLVVVALPAEAASRVLAAARERGSANERSALVAMVDAQRIASGKEGLQANRVLRADCSAGELQEAVASVLEVAPRAAVQAPIKLRFGLDQPSSQCRVTNLSVSGMLVGGLDGVPVGSEFGFELLLPGEESRVLGRAQVVRHSVPAREGVAGLGASFVTLGGEGADRLRMVVDRTIQEAAAAGSPARSRPRRTIAATGPQAAARHREELEELSSYLDDLLSRGLHRRFEVADWYLTGAELGLESIRAFYGILEAVYSGTLASRESDRGLDDLKTVHRELADLAKPGRAIEDRVRIMLGIRRPLERLLLELDREDSDGHRGRGMVSRLAADIGRLFATRRSLENLRVEVLDLMRPRYLFARRACRRRAVDLQRRYGRLTQALGVEGIEALVARRNQRRALDNLAAELERLATHLRAVHGCVYQGRLQPRASGDVEKDLAGEGFLAVLADVLGEGAQYLVRAYSVYRHALEAVGSGSALLERAARLAQLVEAAPAPSRRAGVAVGAGWPGERHARGAPAPASNIAQA